jgi:hypothetical protein
MNIIITLLIPIIIIVFLIKTITFLKDKRNRSSLSEDARRLGKINDRLDFSSRLSGFDGNDLE